MTNSSKLWTQKNLMAKRPNPGDVWRMDLGEWSAWTGGAVVGDTARTFGKGGQPPMNDPHIEEIRRVRHLVSREVGHDLHKLMILFTKLEGRFSRPSVDYGSRRTSESSGFADNLVPDGVSTPGTP